MASNSATGFTCINVKTALKPLFILAGLSALLGAAMSSALSEWQSRLIFEPEIEIPHTPEDYHLPYQDVRIPVGNGHALHGWWITGGERVLLFLHGNSGNISKNLPRAVRFNRLGFSVLMVDYRGFGSSSAEGPNETRVYEDAEAAYWFLRNQGVPAQDIFIYGHSLGGAIAVELAARVHHAAGLILESTFTSLADVARERLPFVPVDRFLRQRFDSLSKIGALSLPVLLIHGTSDRKIPFQMSERLFEAVASTKKKLLLVANGDHSSSGAIGRPLYFKAIREFVAATGGSI
ncbi:MAG: alpha/beta hydrolase [Burkholderiales bacterium]